MSLAAGAKVDGYEVLGLLGAGGMGEVYRARDPILKRDVAIKVLPPFVARDPDRLWRFEQEAQAAAALNHPNILSVYRFGVFEGAPYLVSELLVGETLRQQLNHGPISLRRAIDIGVQIAHGLAAAHDKGIVHRDLKPENLFVTKEGRIKILDFGLAKLMQPQQPQADKDDSAPTQTYETESGLVMGTAGYMSPEMVRGELVDHRADIFAFGAILYEILAGKRAFQHSTSAETMTAILREDPPGVSQIARNTPPGLQRVVHRCLEKNSERRFQSSSDLAFALEALSDSDISSSTAAQWPEPRRQRRALAWWIGLAAIVAASIATYYFATDRAQVPFAHYSLERVIDSKHVGSLAISPDGIYLAAVLNDANGAQSLLLHHIPTNSQRTIVQDPAYKYDRVTFSPDGSYIYFRIDALGQPRPNRWDEYRIPVLGGLLTRVIAGVDFPLAFIGGGQRVCFYRKDLTAGSYQFLSASTDGSDQQVLANGKKPFPVLAVCSPSGRFAVLEDTLGNVESLDFSSGSARTIASSAALGGYLNDMQWIPNGKGLLITRWEKIDFAPVSFLSYPSGKMRQITNDLSVYSGISLTADARTIATTQNDLNARFAELPLAESASLQEDQTGELVWFTWLDNNTIVANGAGNLRVINLLKHETTAVNVKNGFLFGQPSFCGRDTMVLVGAALQGDVRRVYTLHLDGSGLTQVTKGPMDSFPECTADGESVLYADATDGNNPILMRQSLRGGAPQKVAQGRIWFDVSADGKLLATAATDKGAPLQIVSLDSLRTIRSFPIRDFDDFARFAFSADSKSVFYVTGKGADATIWRQPLETGTPVKVATLPGRTVNWIRPSPDGKKLGLILEATTSEAVLLHDVR
jgi:serine/threonine protein kinase/WD40 repeat protein